MTERERFKASHKHLDLSETKDAWDRPVFAHSHVEAMWSGWQAALESCVLAERKQEPVAWRIRIGDSDIWSYVGSESDADFYGKQSGLKYEKEPLFTHPTPDDAKRFPYQQTFDAIAFATKISGGGIEISVEKFRKAFAAIDAAMKEQKESGT